MVSCVLCARDCDADNVGVRKASARFLEVLARSLPHLQAKEGDVICASCRSKAYSGGAAHRSGVRGRRGSTRSRKTAAAAAAATKGQRAPTPEPVEVKERLRMTAVRNELILGLENKFTAALHPGSGRFSLTSLSLTHPVLGTIDVTILPAAPAEPAEAAMSDD